MKLRIVLHVLGLVIMLCAVLADHATELPFVLRLIAPKYWEASQGMRKLRETKSLAKSDTGFHEIETLLLSNKWPSFLAYNPVLSNSTCVATVEKLWVKLEFGMSGDSVVAETACFHLGLKVHNGKSFDILPVAQDDDEKCFKVELKQMVSQVEDLKSFSIVCAPLVIFLIGAAIETWAFMIENRKEHKASH